MELIYNDLISHNGFKQYLVYNPTDTLLNFHSLFGDRGLKALNYAVMMSKGKSFYDIKRYHQFVGVMKYSEINQLFTMSFFEGTNMDCFLDGFSKLASENWHTDQLKKIGEIAQQIIDDPKQELATLKFNKIL